MNQYVGLDVSLEETKIHVLDETGGRVWRGKCASHPGELETTICQHAPDAMRIGLETGPLTTWLWTELRKRGLPMVCLDARAAQRALDMRANKTDANDADGAGASRSRRRVQGGARQEPRRHALEGGLGRP